MEYLVAKIIEVWRPARPSGSVPRRGTEWTTPFGEDDPWYGTSQI